jgi:hypothetical protein
MRLLLATLVALVLCASASATTGDPRYDTIASGIAQQPVTVACYAHDEVVDPYHMDPDMVGAWGYVYLEDTVVNLAPEVCDGLKDAQRNIGSVWAGLGAIVLTHESYHLAKRYGNRGDEAKTECRAVKNVQATIAALGLSGANARAAYFWALTWDWRTIWSFPQYFDKTCKRDTTGEVGVRLGRRS